MYNDNLVLVTSVINTPQTPLSYCPNRSTYSREQRFQQTKKTIASIKQKIPNCAILLVECSELTEEERNYFENNCEYILNLWNISEIHSSIFGISKALGEGTMTIKALEYIFDNKIQYNNLFKISGRYWLNDTFIYDKYDNNKLVFKKINGNIGNILTLLFKIPYIYAGLLLEFLKDHVNLMHQYIGYEVLFGIFIKFIAENEIIYYDTLGVEGYVSISVNEFYVG